MAILVSSHISLSMTRQGGFEMGSNVTEQFHIDAIFLMIQYFCFDANILRQQTK